MPPPSLAPAWRDYRTRRRSAACALAGLAPALVAATRAWPLVTLGESAGPLLAAAWLTGTFAAVSWFAAFRCPFCGEFFHWTLWVANPLSGECLHCGFRRWRDPEAARALLGR
jgi:Zn ribbon nucleic-acid-binding protein